MYAATSSALSFATLAMLRAGSAARFLTEGLLDLALPPGCAGCGSFADAPRPLCRSCRSRLTAAAQADPTAAPEGLNACCAACIYAGDAERWLQAFKYPAAGIAGTDPAPGAVLRALVAEAACAAPGPPPGLVVPVPLWPRRLRERGFNPAAILAHAVARESGAPLSTRALHRRRDTPSQTGLERRARRRNVAGAFRCEGSVAPVVWLVDDVVTTGATLSACARALRRAGARRIVAVCAARTPFADGPNERTASGNSAAALPANRNRSLGNGAPGGDHQPSLRSVSTDHRSGPSCRLQLTGVTADKLPQGLESS